jgi:hypothetical protein
VSPWPRAGALLNASRRAIFWVYLRDLLCGSMLWDHGGMTSRDVSTNERTQEARVRRKAARQALAVQRSRRRDPRAVDYGLYCVVDVRTKAVVAGTQEACSMTLDEVERYLDGDV